MPSLFSRFRFCGQLVIGQVDAFRVDGIPHLAMVNSKGEVETAIIGTVPKNVSTQSVCEWYAIEMLMYSCKTKMIVT